MLSTVRGFRSAIRKPLSYWGLDLGDPMVVDLFCSLILSVRFFVFGCGILAGT